MNYFLAIIQAIPVLEKWFQELVALYVTQRIASMEKQNIEVIKKALESHDQREIEKVLRSDKAGLPSGTIGSEIRKDLPNVK